MVLKKSASTKIPIFNFKIISPFYSAVGMYRICPFFVLLALLMSHMALAQDIPPVYSQFYMNPAVYNPSFAGSDGYTSLYVVHRRQWVGIEGAPTASSLSLHAPFSQTVAAGLLITHQQAGILHHSSAEGQFAYILPIGKDHDFRMGLGAGVRQFRLDLTEATPEQQAYLAEHMDSHTRFLAKFGINYHFKGLHIGLSSNSLFRNRLLTSSDKLLSLAPQEDLVLNALYYFPLVPGQLQLEPYVIHHRLGSFQRNEAGLLFYFKDTFWTGASYRTDYGLTGIFGLHLQNTVKVAYAYEFGNAAVSGFQHSSHELQLAIKLGKEKSFTRQVIRKPRFESQ